MKADETLKSAHRQLALQPLGVHPGQGRLFESQQGAMFSHGELLRLPPSIGSALQAADGALFFMVGQSAVGGLADPIAG